MTLKLEQLISMEHQRIEEPIFLLISTSKSNPKTKNLDISFPFLQPQPILDALIALKMKMRCTLWAYKNISTKLIKTTAKSPSGKITQISKRWLSLLQKMESGYINIILKQDFEDLKK